MEKNVITNRKGLVQKKQGGCLDPHVHMLCLMCSFTPQPAECNWHIGSKELLLLIFLPSFVCLLPLIFHLVLRSCRAGQHAAWTDGGLGPALVQWTDPMHSLAKRLLDLMYFLCLCVCQSCSHLWLHLKDWTVEVPCNPVPPLAAAQLSWLLTECFEEAWDNRNTTQCCEHEM